MKHPPRIAVLLGCAAVAGCTTPVAPTVKQGQDAYQVAQPQTETKLPQAYKIGEGDELSLAVFGEPDLSAMKLVVDEAGRIQVPLVGSVMVAGMSPDEATNAIQTQLAARYLRDPKVTLNVIAAAEKLVSVEGQVNHAGSYPITPNTTLLGAVAMAQSPTRIAKLDETMLFRIVNGQRMVARFDIKRIRAGIDPDPQVFAGDVIVVGFSQSKSAYRDIISMAGLLNVLTRF